MIRTLHNRLLKKKPYGPKMAAAGNLSPGILNAVLYHPAD